jgi:hypothetical protein
LRNELERAIAQSHAHARKLGQSNAEMIAVRHHNVAKRFEIGAKGGQLGKKGRGRQLAIRRHVSKLRVSRRRRHAAASHTATGTQEPGATDRNRSTKRSGCCGLRRRL